MISDAHRRSRHAIIDPVYDAARIAPARPSGKGPSWWYGNGELEAYRLSLVRVRGYRDCRNVFHPGLFHRHQHVSSFRCSFARADAPSSLRVRAVGGFSLALNWRVIHHQADATDGTATIPLKKFLKDGENSVMITVTGISEPGCIQIAGLEGWEWSADAYHWTPAKVFAAGDRGQPPHRDELIEIPLKSKAKLDELDDFGMQLLAKPIIRGKKPRLFVGESPAEARNRDPQGMEQRLDLVPHGKGTWIAKANLALRYVAVEGGTLVGAQAAFHPVQYRGAFACSDKRLNEVWMRSAYTLRLCLHDFLIDGVKRDRMPWVGDFALALLGNAYCFHDREIVRRTLVALGGERVEDCMLNAIIDYSLWWIVSLDLYASHFGDRATVDAEHARLRKLLAVMDSRCDERGYLIPLKEDWLFVDWVPYDRTGAVTALQCVWAWALASAGRVLGDPVLVKRADALRRRLRKEAWNGSAYRESIDNVKSGPSRHASAFAVLAGVSDAKQATGIAATLRGSDAPAVGTPYAEAFCAQALARLGDTEGMLGRIRGTWGAMLDLGATTFWEGYDPTHSGDQHWGFYGRPFAKSLCHAWGAGPAVLLPAEILGIRPLADGWSRFAVAPRLGDLAWASAAVPMPHGDIAATVEAGRLALTMPRGTVAEVGGKHYVGGKRHVIRLTA